MMSFYFLGTLGTLAQEISEASRFAAVDAHVAKVSKEFVYHPQALAKNLSDNLTNDYDKVRAYYVWIAKNIKYDFLAYIHEDIGSKSVLEITRSGKTLCTGFSLLFAYFCEQTGIEVEIIEGYAKGYGYKKGEKFKKTNHSWNAVNIYGTWYLVDVTWATGDPRKFAAHEKTIDVDTYFLTDPKKFIKSHLPEDPTWQLLDQKISLEEFESNQYENKHKWIYNSWSPNDYDNLDEYETDLLYYKRAMEFSQRDRSICTHLSFAYLYKGISLTDNLWKMTAHELYASQDSLSTQFYAYMDSALQTSQKLKYLRSVTHLRIINDEINYQSGVFNYELGVEFFSKGDIMNQEALSSEDLVATYFDIAKNHFNNVDESSIYHRDANEYLVLIDEFRQRNPLLAKPD